MKFLMQLLLILPVVSALTYNARLSELDRRQEVFRAVSRGPAAARQSDVATLSHEEASSGALIQIRSKFANCSILFASPHAEYAGIKDFCVLAIGQFFCCWKCSCSCSDRDGKTNMHTLHSWLTDGSENLQRATSFVDNLQRQAIRTVKASAWGEFGRSSHCPPERNLPGLPSDMRMGKTVVDGILSGRMAFIKRASAPSAAAASPANGKAVKVPKDRKDGKDAKQDAAEPKRKKPRNQRIVSDDEDSADEGEDEGDAASDDDDDEDFVATQEEVDREQEEAEARVAEEEKAERAAKRAAKKAKSKSSKKKAAPRVSGVCLLCRESRNNLQPHPDVQQLQLCENCLPKDFAKLDVVSNAFLLMRDLPPSV